MAADRLLQLLSHIYETKPFEIDCSRLQDLLPLYVEREFDQALPPLPDDQLAAVRFHLQQCPDCREEYEGLRALMDLAPDGELPQLDDLMTRFEDEKEVEEREPAHHR